MPEEHLTYVGLVPFFLACMTAVREWRRDRERAAAGQLLAVVTLVLSLGPYVPGFRWLIMLHGFSFFRAPSRWSVATALALALLAGKGFDRWGEWARPGRSLRRLALLSICWVGVTLGLIELATLLHGQAGMAGSRPGLPASLFRAALEGRAEIRRRSWHRRETAGGPAHRVRASQTILSAQSEDERIFADQRLRIYTRELGEAVALVVLVLLVGG